MEALFSALRPWPGTTHRLLGAQTPKCMMESVFSARVAAQRRRTEPSLAEERPLQSAPSHRQPDSGSGGASEQRGGGPLRENSAVMLAVLLTLLAALAALLWWRGVPVPGIGRRVELRGEANTAGILGFAKPEAVRIGETFVRMDAKAGPPGQAWPGFRGSDATNVAPSSVKLSDHWPDAGPPRLWSIPLGEGYAGASIRDGRAYVLDYDDKAGADALRVFSMQDGRELWRRSYRVHVKRNHGMSRTIPAVDARHVVSIGPRCHVMCADAVNGDLRWGMDLEKDWGATVPMWYTGQNPLIDQGQAILAVGAKALLIGVDLDSGKVLWQTPNPHNWQMSHSSVMPMTLGGRKMYVYAAVGGMVGVSAEGTDRGTVLWESEAWNPAIVSPSPVAVGPDDFLMTSGYGVGSALYHVARSGPAFAVTERYRLDKSVFACEQQTPIFFGGHLYTILPADAGPLRKQAACIGSDGKVAWTSGAQERFGLGPFLIADSKLFLLDDDGTLTMAKATERGFERLARAKVLEGKESWAPMALADGHLLIRDYTQMVCLDLSEHGGAR